VSNPLRGESVTYVGANDYEIRHQEAQHLFEKLGGKRKIIVIDGHTSRPNQSRTHPRVPAAFADPFVLQVAQDVASK
jgi:hypothetical protein